MISSIYISDLSYLLLAQLIYRLKLQVIRVIEIQNFQSPSLSKQANVKPFYLRLNNWIIPLRYCNSQSQLQLWIISTLVCYSQKLNQLQGILVQNVLLAAKILEIYRIIRMLDITSYRRKQKYAQSLTVMRELYHEYSRAHKSKTSCIPVAQDPLARQTLSVDRFSKCLRQLQNQNDRESTANIPMIKTDNQSDPYKQQMGKQKNNAAYYSTSRMITINKQPTTKKKESGYFKSDFSSTVSLFNAHHGIKRLDLIENRAFQQPKDSSKKPQILNILFERKQLQMKNPTQILTQMIKQKNGMENKLNAKKNHLRKIRHDWIISNLYHHPETESDKKLKLDRPRCRTRDLFSTTKENIFPQ